jgi:hypothetical protein
MRQISWIDKEHISRHNVPLEHGNVQCVFETQVEE